MLVDDSTPSYSYTDDDRRRVPLASHIHQSNERTNDRPMTTDWWGATHPPTNRTCFTASAAAADALKDDDVEWVGKNDFLWRIRSMRQSGRRSEPLKIAILASSPTRYHPVASSSSSSCSDRSIKCQLQCAAQLSCREPGHRIIAIRFPQ